MYDSSISPVLRSSAQEQNSPSPSSLTPKMPTEAQRRPVACPRLARTVQTQSQARYLLTEP